MYHQRVWQGEPTTGEGVMHAALEYTKLSTWDAPFETACGLDAKEPDFFSAPATATVTCWRCLACDRRIG